ncbi:MAG: hypothetical protein P1V36_04920, partial [Planctomycetota bacterium]|nr:hypothetical protein [Planctomycetota bacterium]
MSPTPRSPSSRARRTAWLVLPGLRLPAALAVGCGDQAADAPTPSGPPQASATYVGAAVCKTCHEDAHASYAQTSHSRALRPVDLAEQPLPHEFTHAPSGLTYRIYESGGALHKLAAGRAFGQHAGKVGLTEEIAEVVVRVARHPAVALGL